MKKILLGQLGAYGDCLFATTIARQIKEDFPDCELTWAIGSAYRSILKANPFVDVIWEVPVRNSRDLWARWEDFAIEANNRKEKGAFDEIFLTQIPPDNFKNFDGTVRSSILRGYNRPITVSDVPVLRLVAEEIRKVKDFAEKNFLSSYKNVILFECDPGSDQSFISPQFGLKVAQMLTQENENTCVILSADSTLPVTKTNAQIIDAGVLSFRENAELSKYCTLLVGCSSGVSWACTSDWARPLPMVQLLAKAQSIYASFIHDYQYRNLKTDSIIEMTNCSEEKVSLCLSAIIESGFKAARNRFNEDIPLNFKFYTGALYTCLLKRGRYKEAFESLANVYSRYGLQPTILYYLLVNFVKQVVTFLFPK